jgi:hypothetical protein
VTDRKVNKSTSRQVNIRPIVFISLLMVMASLLASIVAAQTSARRTPGRWDARLEQLRPREPEQYLELAEEVYDAAANDADRDLARHLFALAGALEPERLGRSACLALADMEENAQAKRRLQALAALLPGPGGGGGWGVWAGGTLPNANGGLTNWSSSAALAVTEALSYYRRGEGARAMTALKAPGADLLLQHFDRLLPGGYQRFIEDCKLYRSGSPPTLSLTDSIRVLRLEAAILSGGERSWSSELLLTGGQALIEVDPLNLTDSLNIDATRPLYRNGRWVEMTDVRS